MSAPKTTVLIVDDDPAMQEVLSILMEEWGFESRIATNGLEGAEIADSWNPDVVISDVVMPDCSGLELLRNLKKGNVGRPVILITAAASIDAAVEAMKEGAQDFLTKPLDYPKLRALLQEAERDVELRAKATKLSSRLKKGGAFGDFVGQGRGMREAYDLIENVASSDASVIIFGESGTGKELAARTIHRLSARNKGPFVAINCAAIPESLIESEVFGHEKGSFTGAVATRAGCFELANTGTLFLDEIAEMPSALQPKLLRVLEDGKVRRLGGDRELSFDVRIIAATNRDPRTAVSDGRLREDLYYRLNVFTIVLPALRDRRDDIPLIAQHFISEFNNKHHRNVDAMRDEAQEMLSQYAWPGNVRELRNVIERAVILAKGNWIETLHLPPYIRDVAPAASKKIVLSAGMTMADAEKELIIRTLEQSGNNKAEAARRLGVDVKTIRNKMKTYRLE
ncbi:MAG TPA: sigma-54 dependent transcriptional regulator [Terriglobia bacterium]|nr:sigma-54 dependent transcriptional regulator [Terriglobia bacterium]